MLVQEEPVEEDEQFCSSEGLHRIKDHLLFNTLSFLVKVIQYCQVIKNPSRQQDMAQIWGKWSFPTVCIGFESHGRASGGVSDSYCQIRNRVDSFLQYDVIPTAHPSGLLVKIFRTISVVMLYCYLFSMTESVEAHLLHPHAWVRLVSSRLLGLLFAAWKPEELVDGYQRGTTSLDYLPEDLPTKV